MIAGFLVGCDVDGSFWLVWVLFVGLLTWVGMVVKVWWLVLWFVCAVDCFCGYSGWGALAYVVGCGYVAWFGWLGLVLIVEIWCDTDYDYCVVDVGDSLCFGGLRWFRVAFVVCF